MSEATEQAVIKAKLTLTEIGVIISLLCSAGVGIFTFGVSYGQVQNNTGRIDKIEERQEVDGRRLERIDANVEFLTQMAREDRAKGK